MIGELPRLGMKEEQIHYEFFGPALQLNNNLIMNLFTQHLILFIKKSTRASLEILNDSGEIRVLFIWKAAIYIIHSHDYVLGLSRHIPT